MKKFLIKMLNKLLINKKSNRNDEWWVNAEFYRKEPTYYYNTTQDRILQK